MRKELDEKLCKEFPNLYADREADMTETCMCWGFSCGDGWFDLIYDLSANLERLILELPEEERVNVRASQVKEKFGTLRFYMTSSTDEMNDLISKAEDKSSQTCETCGLLGKAHNDGWVRTICDSCLDNRENS